MESLVGVGAARIRDLFAKARDAAPAIVFIDELDAVGRKRGAGVGQGNDEREQTLNQLLVEMDGFDAGRGLIVLAATNRPDILDPALLRPGRFDRQITVDAPDAEGRAEILELYLEGRPHTDDVIPAEIARRCPGFTGAELENVVNEAALLSARSGHTAIAVHDVEEAIQRVVGGPRTETHVLSEDELETIAIHEAAHAVVAAAQGDGGQVHGLSIVARGRRLGRATTLLLDRDRTVLRRSDLERQLTVTMAGAAAERAAFGEVSTAVNEDLHTATQLARSMVTLVRHVRARPGDDRRAQRRDLPRRVAAGAGQRRARDARAHRRRDARDRRGGRGARRDDPAGQLGRRGGDRARPRRVRDARGRAPGRPSPACARPSSNGGTRAMRPRRPTRHGPPARSRDIGESAGRAARGDGRASAMRQPRGGGPRRGGRRCAPWSRPGSPRSGPGWRSR